MFGRLTKRFSAKKSPVRRASTSRLPALQLEPLEFREVPAVVGGLDPSFGTGGKVTAFSGVGTGGDVAVDSLGRTVVVGNAGTGAAEDFLVTRYNVDGTIDKTFGNQGKVTIDFGNSLDVSHAIAVDSKDNVIVAGLSLAGGMNSMAFARLTSSGTLDPTFGGGASPAGTKLIPLTVGSTGVTDITLDKAGNIVAIGSQANANFDFAVVRLLPNGSAIDPTFNGGAVKSFDGGAAGADFGNGVALDGNGNIVGVGQSLSPTSKFAAFRLLANGTALDPTFNAGKVLLFTTNATSLNGAFSVAVDGANNVYMAGFNNDNAGTGSAAIAKLTATGAHDQSFGNNGVVGVFTSTLAGKTGTANGASDLYVRADGRIVAAGSTQPTAGAPRDFAVFQLLPNGQLDTSFNPTGPAPGIDSFDFGANHNDVVGDTDFGRHGLAVGPDGRIVVAGSDVTVAGGAVQVARLIGTVEKGTSLAVGGSTDGKGAVYVPNPATGQYPNTPTAVDAPFGMNGANVRTATADVNGDGIADTIFVTGPGTPLRVAVVSGKDNSTVLVSPFDPFGGDFTGGGFVAAGDFDLDGRAEFVVTPDQGGGPRVAVFSLGADGKVVTRANFLTLDANFRGGARAAVGDVNGDGVADLVVAAGFGGGPRVTILDGKKVFTTNGINPADKLASDFFAFPDVLRNGVYVAVGDVNADGFGDLVIGAGPGGGPQVLTVSGKTLLTQGANAAIGSPISNFFVANTDSDRGGVRVATVDADGDGKADVAVGTGDGRPSRVRVYLGKNFGGGEPGTFQDLDPFHATLTDGVYVG